MRGFVVVARREVLERRSIFLAAAVLALLPFLAPLVPAFGRFGTSELRLTAAAFFATAFSTVLSLILGASAIGRDLSERRLGFYFARPIGSGAIWTGKLFGVWILVVASAAVILLPTALADFSSWAPGAGRVTVRVLILFLGTVILFLGLGNIASLAFRSRPIWLAGDLVLLMGWALASWLVARPLFIREVHGALETVLIVLAFVFAVGLLAAGGAQVVWGRVDPVRGNRVRFATLWLVLFAAAAIAAGYVRWFLSPKPEDLRYAWISALAPRGSWIEIGGLVEGRGSYRAGFLFDLDTHRFIRTGHLGLLVFSEDGKTAVWAEPSGFARRSAWHVRICHLDGRNPAVLGTVISVSSPSPMALSEDGQRLAVASGRNISVFETRSGRLLASASLPNTIGDGFAHLAFVRAGVLRICWPHQAAARELGEPSAVGNLRVFDLDVEARRLVATATIEPLQRPFSVTYDDRAARMLIWERGHAVSLFDSSIGARLASIEETSWVSSSRAFLSDGRAVIAICGKDGIGHLHLIAREGQPERVIEVGRAGQIALGAQPLIGQLAIAIAPTPQSLWTASDTFLIDLESGQIRAIGKRLYPVASLLRWRSSRFEPGSEATLLFRSHNALVRWSPGDGAMKVVFADRER